MVNLSINPSSTEKHLLGDSTWLNEQGTLAGLNVVIPVAPFVEGLGLAGAPSAHKKQKFLSPIINFFAARKNLYLHMFLDLMQNYCNIA